jgi:NAD(P) transhydrogenase
LEQVDFLVVGSGPAGQKAAIQAAKLGKKVCLVERRTPVGGVTLHTGTIPSKTLREAVLYLTGWRQRSFYGQGYRLKNDVTFEDLIERLHITIRHETEVIRDQLVRNGVGLVDGHASFLGPHRVSVERANGEICEIEAAKILLATGTTPARPAGIPFDERRIIDSDGLLGLGRLPRTLTVIGAGVIGVEYATIFAALDIKVALVDGRPQMLGFLDHEIVSDLQYHLRDRGIVMRLGEELDSVEEDGTGKVVTRLKSGKRLRSDVVLFAAGRTGCTESLGLQAAGLSAGARGLLQVDERFRTAVPHIYAAGDVIGFPSLASTSMEQGRLAACDAFGRQTHTFPEHFPFGIYAVPEISMVGKTEQELSKDGVPYEVGTARLRETARGQILGIDFGVLKMIFSLETRRVLGVHILGEQSTELIHIGQAALALGGTLDYFVENVFNYPTLAEAYKVAALDAWNRMQPGAPGVLDALAKAERELEARAERPSVRV